jgi:hypothetical protein
MMWVQMPSVSVASSGVVLSAQVVWQLVKISLQKSPDLWGRGPQEASYFALYSVYEHDYAKKKHIF